MPTHTPEMGLVVDSSVTVPEIEPTAAEAPLGTTSATPAHPIAISNDTRRLTASMQFLSSVMPGIGPHPPTDQPSPTERPLSSTGDAGAVAAGALGLVERSVGGLEQPVGIVRVSRPGGDAG